MSKFCTSCGKKIADDATFCNFCGSRQPAPKAPAAEPEKKKAAPAKRSAPAETGGKAAPKAETKKKGGCGLKIIAVLLAVVLLFTGFVLPGFFWDIIYPDEPDPVYTVPGGNGGYGDGGYEADARGLSAEEVFLPESLGNSMPVDCEPCEGVHVTAAENAFEEDTVIRMTPISEADATARQAFSEMEAGGAMPIAAFEVDAGLSDDDIMPGTYTVSIDLDTLGISECLYDYLTVYRIADDGTYYEYAARVENGKLVYESDQNCLATIAIYTGIVIGANIGFKLTTGKWVHEIVGDWYDDEYNAPFKYFADTKKKKSSFKVDGKYASYRITWNMGDLGIDEKGIISKMEKIKEDYESKSAALYQKYKEDKYARGTGILSIFSANKTEAEVVAEAVANDETYKKLSEQLRVPDAVAFCARCAELSFQYLKEHEYVKMPTGVVEIVSGKDGGSTLGLATARKINEAYVEISLPNVNPGTKAKRDGFLLTMTHELLHVCQTHYRAPWADSIRFDEMVAVYTEKRALSQFIYEGEIDEESNVELTGPDYWSTLKLPLDMYYAGEDGETMKHEGYNLSLFLEYLQEKTGKVLWADRLMRAKSYFKEGGITKPLMSVFGISEAELDVYYRGFARTYKERFASHYHPDLKGSDQYKLNKAVTIEPGNGYHADVRPDGGYSAEIRCFTQSSNKPMPLLLIKDRAFDTDQPDCDILPVDPYEAIAGGYYIPPKEAKDNLNRYIFEIHGDFGDATNERLTGYTVYTVDQTKTVTPNEDENDLILELPENSCAADGGAIDGYVLRIEAENGASIIKVISDQYFEKEYRVSKDEIYGKTERNRKLGIRITLCEFVAKNETDIIALLESDTVYYELGMEMAQDLSIFAGVWAPLEYKGSFKSSDWVVGLTYNEQYDEFFEYEGPASTFYSAPGRWVEIKYYDFDSKTGTLSIDFGKNKANGDGVATFRIKANGNLEMTNYGGTYEFYRAGAEEGF